MRILTHALLAVAIASSLTRALAADVPTHKDAPLPAPPAPVSPWGGFYLGGFAGAAFAHSGQSLSMTDPTIATLLPNLIPQLQNDASQSLGARGAEVGLQAGYDWSLRPGFVVGVAGDFGWSGLSGQRTTDNFLTRGIVPLPLNPYILTQQLRSDWDGSLRLRAGATPLDNVLIYATGGLALREFHYRTTFWDRLDNPPFPVPGNETEDVTFGAVRAGWTLGAGAEWRLSRNWSISGEYRHSEFASVGGQDLLPLIEPPSTANVSHATGAIHIDSLRIGVNYHFN